MNANNVSTNTENSSIDLPGRKKPSIWSEEEDKILIEKSKEYGYKNWATVASFIPGRSAIQCSARYKRIQPGLIKGAWTPEEDQELLRLYRYYGKNWSHISKSMPHRTGKQIRDRFLNALDDNLKKDKFTKEEDRKVVKWYKVYGNSWCRIAKKIKGRTGDMVKNRFYSSLKNHLDEFDEEEKEIKKKKGRKKEKDKTGKRIKRHYIRKKNITKKENIEITHKEYEIDKKDETINPSNNEEQVQEIIKPLPIMNEKNAKVSFSNDIKVPLPKTNPLLRRNSSIFRMQSSKDNMNIDDNYDNTFVISNKSQTNSVLRFRNDSSSEVKDNKNALFKNKVEQLKSLIRAQRNTNSNDNYLSQLNLLKELQSLTKAKIDSLTQNK